MAQMAALQNADPATMKVERSVQDPLTVTKWDHPRSTRRLEARMKAMAATEAQATRMALEIKANKVFRWLMVDRLHLCVMYLSLGSKATFKQKHLVAKRQAIRVALPARPRSLTQTVSQSRNRGRNALQNKLRRFQSSSV